MSRSPADVAPGLLATWLALQLVGAALAWLVHRNDTGRAVKRAGGLRDKFVSYIGITLGILLLGWLPEELFRMVLLTWMTFTILEFHSAVDHAETEGLREEEWLGSAGSAILAAAFAALYAVRASDPTGGAWGYLWLIVGTTDAYSQLFGQGWGKRQMAPVLSPGKMWEGFLGGTASAVLAGAAMAFVFPKLSREQVALLALLLTLAASAGDLIASAVKRHLRTKDFSELLGTHGGLLDRFDSLLAAALVFAPLLALLP
ncbi:MAG: CDP-archaeol synthase [Candidatus Wallbacteria bacterium]|nr:CDP-archaeol synthase [Candidatus Wallbacteria bacterium]